MHRPFGGRYRGISRSEAKVEDYMKTEVKAISGQCNSGTSQMTQNDVKFTFKVLIKTVKSRQGRISEETRYLWANAH